MQVLVVEDEESSPDLLAALERAGHAVDVATDGEIALDLAPVLMLTAREEVSSKVRGLDAGADDYSRNPSSSMSSWLGSAPS